MLESIKTYKQSVGAIRFIGKKYSSGRDAWTEWREKGLFDSIKKQININFTDLYEDGDALIGLMCHRDGNHSNFEYWLGYFTPENTIVPEGLEFEELFETNMGIFWFYEKDEQNNDLAPEALAHLEKEGFIITTEWWFERYSPNRINYLGTLGENDDTIMDIGFFII